MRELSDASIFDGVRIRLLEIGEAVKAIPAEITDRESDIPWSQIARMRGNLPTATSTPATPSS